MSLAANPGQGSLKEATNSSFTSSDPEAPSSYLSTNPRLPPVPMPPQQLDFSHDSSLEQLPPPILPQQPQPQQQQYHHQPFTIEITSVEESPVKLSLSQSLLKNKHLEGGFVVRVKLGIASWSVKRFFDFFFLFNFLCSPSHLVSKQIL